MTSYLPNRLSYLLSSTSSALLTLFLCAQGGRLLRLMLRSGALRSTDSELVQACIKGLTALFALHNNRLAARADTRAMNKGKRAMKELNSLVPAGKHSPCSAVLCNLTLQCSFYLHSAAAHSLYEPLSILATVTIWTHLDCPP
jgi:hypothetical protein